MRQYRVIAIPSELVREVRATGKAPRYGHPAHTEIATGYGPCRHCLRTFHVGEESRTLFTYDSFFGVEKVPLPGPVFVHADFCERYSERGGYPQDLLKHAAVLNAYAKGQKLVTQAHVENGSHETVVQQLLAGAEIDYIQVHDRKAGCFDFRIEPVPEAGANLGVTKEFQS
ncbi:MAG: DUF1203 domain-containing protein [Candidatus Acidiferrales bacterium]